MECQNTAKNLKINKEKSIGTVIIVVEGEKDEFKLLKHIFTEIFEYNYYPIKRNKIMKNTFVSKNNKNSTIIVTNTSNSNIKSIMEDEDYKDKLYKFLKEEYNRSLKNVPIYILWDRDTGSNDKDITLKSLKTFSSSMDNDYNMNGLLLLSYPCIEVYELSNFEKLLYKKNFKISNDVKKEWKSFRYNLINITDKTLLVAVQNMHRTMKEYGIKDYDPSNFRDKNIKIFNIEEKEFSTKQYLNALSLISIMLIDLGLITEK